MITRLNVASDLRPRQGRGARLLRQQARAREGLGRQAGRLPLADRPRPGRPGRRDLARAAGPAAPRRGHRRAAPRAHHQGRPGRPRLPHRRRPRPLRDAPGARRHRLHPGAHRPLLRHRHGPPRPVRQRHPDPRARRSPSGDGLTDDRKEPAMTTRRPRRKQRHARRQGLDGRRAGRDAGERPRAKGGLAPRAPPRNGPRANARSRRRSPRCRSPIARWPSGSTRSSRRARRPSCRGRTTGCPPTPRTARSSASSSPPRSSRCGTRRSASSPTRGSTTARCGRSPSR